MNDNLENNTESVNSEPIVATPEATPTPSVETLIPSGETNPGITSFTPEEVVVPTSAPTTTEPVSPIENLAKKEVVTRPLLWGVVVFLVFFALVIGAVSVYRYYQDQNKPVEDASILPATTPANTQSTLDTTPVSTDTKVQADAISAEVQSIDTDIEGDVLSDSSLGL